MTDTLFHRLRDGVRKPASSGSAGHFKQWALEVAGVGDAKVYPVWNGGGTVKVVLLDTEKTSPAPSVVTAAATYIESQRPIGVTVTVVGATELAINVTATLTLDAGANATDVQTQFTASLADYLKSIAFTGEQIRYTRIANLLIDIAGVIDYANLTVNGGTANIQPTDEQVGVVGTVTLS